MHPFARLASLLAMAVLAAACGNEPSSRWVELGGEARYALSPKWSFLGALTQRRTKHPGPDAWEDRRATYQLGVTRTLLKQAQLFVRYEHERNASPVENYDYDRNWVAASIEFWR